MAATFAVKLSAAGTNEIVLPKTNGLAPLKISAADATNYYDQEMIVTGKVEQVTIRPTVTFLNLDGKFPDSPFAIVIIHGKSSYYGDANALKEKQIEIRGKITKYKDKPEIALDSTNQLTVLYSNDLTNAPATRKRTRKIKAPVVSQSTNAEPVTPTPDTPSTNSLPEIM